jgi:ribosomal protein S4
MHHVTKTKLFMSVKRNFPRYKRISKFKPLVRPELRSKILLNFTREKWRNIKKKLFPRKFICYHQDVGNVFLRKKYFVDRTTRRKRIYRFLLRDRQRLQFYYGNGRIRYFQLKALGLKALKFSKNNDISGPTAFLAVLEHRLAAFLYRLRFVTFLTDARPFVADGYVEVGNTVIKDYNFTLTEFSIVKFDPKILYFINYHYFTQCVTFFYEKHTYLIDTIILQKRHYEYLPFVNKEKSVKHIVFLFKRFVRSSKKSSRIFKTRKGLFLS